MGAAKLYFRYGAMNCGKSTALLQAAFNYEERGQHVLLAKPPIDSKGDNAIVSRLGMSRRRRLHDRPGRGHLRAIFAASASRVINARPGHDVACLLVDEAQFLGEGQVDDLLRIAIERGRPGARLRHPHRLPDRRVPREPAAARDRALASKS